MAVARNIIVRIGADISQLQKSLGDAQKQLKSFGSDFTAAGKTLSTALTLPLAGLGAMAVKTASDFEQAMANAASVSGATADEFERMKNVAREMGKTTVFSAKDAADAMYYMASAGWKAGQMADAIKPTLDLAAATQSELAFTTDTVVASLNQFGLKSTDTSRVTNTFAAAIGNSQATLEKLSYSMRYAGPVANSLGYSIEETTAALGLLYNAGFQGEQAGTILRGALSRLMKPTKEITQTLGEMGIKYSQVNPATNSLADIIKVLGDKSITTAQAVAIFGQEAGPGMMALIGQGSQALLDMQSKISGTDSAAQMAATQLNTFQGQMKILQSAIQEVAIQFGNILIPVLRDLIDKYVAPAVQWFSNLSDGMKKKIVIIGAVVAAIGPLLMAIGAIASGISTLLPIIAALTGPVGLVIAGIAALVAIIIHLWRTNENFRNAVIQIWEYIKQIALTIFGYLKEFWDQWGSTILAIAQVVWNQIKIVIETAIYLIKDILGLVLAVIRGDWEEAWERIKSIGLTIWDFITRALENLKNIWGIIWGVIKDEVLSVWDGIVSGIKGAINWVIGAINKFIDGVNNIRITVPAIEIPLVGKIGGFTIGLPQIPKIPLLAEGGIVTRPTIAMIGEGGESEAVIPLSKLGELNNREEPRPIIIYLDGKKIYEGIDNYLGNRLVALGGL